MAKCKKIISEIKKLDVIVLLLIIWEVFSRWIYPGIEPQAKIFLPPPSFILKEYWQLLSSNILFHHIAASFKRVLFGFFLASLFGVIFGFIIGLSRRAHEQLRIICNIFRPIPPIAWIPISLLWFGITEKQQYFIIFIGVLFPVLFNTSEGVYGVSAHYKYAAQALGVKGLSLVKRVVLPAALPRIMLGLRSGFGYAWFIIVAAEFVSAPNGLGYLILEGRNALVTERIFVGMITIGIINLIFYYFLTKLENWIAPWKKIAFIR